MRQLQFRRLSFRNRDDPDYTSGLLIVNGVPYRVHLITWKFAGRWDHCISLTSFILGGDVYQGVSVKYYHNKKFKYYPPFPGDIDVLHTLIIGNEFKDGLNIGLKRIMEGIIEVNYVIEGINFTSGTKLVNLLSELDNQVDFLKEKLMALKIPKH